jgi:hypothetical protein
MRCKLPHVTVRSRRLGGACAAMIDRRIVVPSLAWCMARAPRRELANGISFFDQEVASRIGYLGCGPRPAARIVAGVGR